MGACDFGSGAITVSGFLRRWWHGWSPAAEKPFRDELLSIERLEERALALAASFTIDPSPRRRGRNIFPRFADNARVLRDAYRTLVDDVRAGESVTGAAEWLLDNFHLVTSEIRPLDLVFAEREPLGVLPARRVIHRVSAENEDRKSVV